MVSCSLCWGWGGALMAETGILDVAFDHHVYFLVPALTLVKV